VGEGQRNRIFRYSPYLALFEEPEVPADAVPFQTTEADA